MIKIERRTLFDIIDGYDRASYRNYRTYNPYLTPAQWATSQTVTNDMNSAIARIEPAEVCIDTGAYTIDSETLRRCLGISPEPDTISAIIDDRAPHIEITEQKLLEFLNGKDDSDANI